MTETSRSHRRPPRRTRSIYQVHYSLPKCQDMPKPLLFGDLFQYDKQVAGHNRCEDAKYLGLLQCSNGTVLKPLIKEAQKREKEFYEKIKHTECPDLKELSEFVPKYYGCRKFTFNGHESEYLILEDLVENMLQPCVMDVKIGKRTYDPLATEEKIRNESSKYLCSKQEFGFCIPGFQVYRLSSERVLKYGKDYGKKLQGQMVKDAYCCRKRPQRRFSAGACGFLSFGTLLFLIALKNFLNAAGMTLCRSLILQILSDLWRIQKWCAHQKAVKLFSASLLITYDANKLRECCGDNDPLSTKPKCLSRANGVRRKSIQSLHSVDGSNFSGQIDDAGPKFKKLQSVPLTALATAQQTFSSIEPATPTPWCDTLQRLNHCHSFQNNYEDTLSKIKINYKSMLDQLTGENKKSKWASVKIIDFAHAFFGYEEDSIDENFKFGIDNLVLVFEEFLKETDCKVF